MAKLSITRVIVIFGIHCANTCSYGWKDHAILVILITRFYGWKGHAILVDVKTLFLLVNEEYINYV